MFVAAVSVFPFAVAEILVVVGFKLTFVFRLGVELKLNPTFNFRVRLAGRTGSLRVCKFRAASLPSGSNYYHSI